MQTRRSLRSGERTPTTNDTPPFPPPPPLPPQHSTSTARGRRPPPPPPPPSVRTDRLVTVQQQQSPTEHSVRDTTHAPQSPTRTIYPTQIQQPHSHQHSQREPHHPASPLQVPSPHHHQQQQQRNFLPTPVNSPPRRQQQPPEVQLQQQSAPSSPERNVPVPPFTRNAEIVVAGNAPEMEQQLLQQPSNTVEVDREPTNWILLVRMPNQHHRTLDQEQHQQYPHEQNPQQQARPIRKIFMTTNSNMDVTTLSDCLQQCLFYNGGISNNVNNNNTPTPNIAGLFCETTQTFYSLQHILMWNNDVIQERQQHIYSIELQVPFAARQQPIDQVDDFWTSSYHLLLDLCTFIGRVVTTNLYVLIPLSIAIYVYYQYDFVYNACTYTYTTMYETMMEQPLRDVYRYGPWFIGWEGDDISTICARITYHGDAQFWLRNTIECNRIYNAKEEAFLRISRPVVYMILSVVLIYTVRFLIHEYQTYQFQLYNNRRNTPIEREMADLYHSFHVILRQILQVHNQQQQQQHLQQPRTQKTQQRR